MPRGKRSRSNSLNESNPADYDDKKKDKSKKEKHKKEKKSKKSSLLEEVDVDNLIAEKKQEEVSRALVTIPDKEAAGGRPGGQLTIAGPKINRILVAACKESRRVHVTNLPQSGNVDQLDAQVTATFKRYADVLRREAINKVLEERGSKPIDESVSVKVDEVLDVKITATHDKLFAFVEMNTADMSTKLLDAGLDKRIEMTSEVTGVPHQLKIKRPSNYTTTGDNVDPNRIVIVSPPANIQEAMWRDLVGQFGTIAEDQFFFVPGKFVYVEYEDEASANKAVDVLLGQNLGGTALFPTLATISHRVQLQSEPYNLTIRNPASDDVLMERVNRKDLVKEFLNLETPAVTVLKSMGLDYPHLRAVGNVPVIPTRILALYNLFDLDELEEDEDYYNLKQDIADEVEKYGCVEEIIIPSHRSHKRPQPPPALDLPPLPDATLLIMPSAAMMANNGTSTSESEELEAKRSEQQKLYDEAVEQRRKIEEEQAEMNDKYQADLRRWDEDMDDPVFGEAKGYAFVEYTTVDDALKAQQGIAGKLFNGRIVITSFLFDDILKRPTEDELAEGEEDEYGAGGADQDKDGDAAPAANEEDGKSGQEAAASAPVAEAADDLD